MQFGNNSASFGCTALHGTNKAGTLKPNAEGYYTVVLGAFDFFNSSGQFYPLAPAEQLFQDSSVFMRRVNAGALWGECGHPRKTPGMSTRDFVARVMDVYEPNIACHIRKVWIDRTRVKDDSGRPIAAVIGEVRPAGPMGPALKDALENPSCDVSFSIRALTVDAMRNGVYTRSVQNILTWDWVNEPGIAVARKWKSPALESALVQDINPALLRGLQQDRRQGRVAMESGLGLSADQVIADLGWDREDALRPSIAKW